MKAITLHQPWASLIAVGVKTIETRSWSTSYRGPLAIHAGARPLTPEIKRDYYGIQPGVAYQSGLVHGPVGARLCNALDAVGYRAADGSDLPLGAVVATCTLTDVVPIFADTLSRRPPFIYEAVGGYLTYWRRTENQDDVDAGAYFGGDWLAINEQRPYGDFTPGRYAWLLDDIEPLTEPLLARGRQRLWEWNEAS